MNTYESEYLAASDKLREVRRRLDALARRWQAGDETVTAEANQLQGEFRQAEADYHRARALAVRAVQERTGRAAEVTT